MTKTEPQLCFLLLDSFSWFSGFQIRSFASVLSLPTPVPIENRNLKIAIPKPPRNSRFEIRKSQRGSGRRTRDARRLLFYSNTFLPPAVVAASRINQSPITIHYSLRQRSRADRADRAVTRQSSRRAGGKHGDEPKNSVVQLANGQMTVRNNLDDENPNIEARRNAARPASEAGLSNPKQGPNGRKAK
jgi:hypothetical protein